MKKRLIATALAMITILSVLTFSASAYYTIDSGDTGVVWNPEYEGAIPINMNKVFDKEYTQEELEAFVENRLSANMRLMGRLFLRARTTTPRKTANDLTELIGTEVTLSTISPDGQYATYFTFPDEAGMRETMLTLLNAGIFFNVHTAEFTDGQGPYVYGDVNMDHKVNAKDYMMVRRMVGKTYRLSLHKELLADINGDYKVDAQDYMILKRHVLGTYEITQATYVWGEDR